MYKYMHTCSICVNAYKHIYHKKTQENNNNNNKIGIIIVNTSSHLNFFM